MFPGLILNALFLSLASGSALQNFPQVGRHYPFLRYEKNENPQNIMMAYVKLDRECKIQDLGFGQRVDFYWLMDGRSYKRVHPLIKRNILKRVRSSELSQDRRLLKVQFFGLEKFGDGLKNTPVVIKTFAIGQGCGVEAQTLNLKLSSIYSRSRKTFVPPFRAVEAIRLNGVESASGRVVERVFTTRR